MLWRAPRRPAAARLARLLGSICTRVTTPLQVARRLLRRRPAGDAPTTSAPSAGKFGKEIARQVFHRFVRLLLRLPGGRQASRLFRAVAPGPVEFLARRYRAYEQRAMPEPVAAFIETETELFIEAEVAVIAEAEPPAMPEAAVALFELSEAEDRLYRQFAARGLAGNATPQGSDPCRPGTAR